MRSLAVQWPVRNVYLLPAAHEGEAGLRDSSETDHRVTALSSHRVYNAIFVDQSKLGRQTVVIVMKRSTNK